MSRTFSIGCRQCRVHLWIAQGWPNNGEPTRHCHIYTDRPHAEAMTRFFFKHQDHPLVFKCNEDDFYGWEEMIADATRDDDAPEARPGYKIVELYRKEGDDGQDRWRIVEEPDVEKGPHA